MDPVIIAVFCQGTPKNPETDLGLQELAKAVCNLARYVPWVPVRVIIFGPRTINPDMSEAEAFRRCLLADGPVEFLYQLVEDTNRVSEHVRQLRMLVTNEQVIVVCDSLAERQVNFHLRHHFGVDTYEVMPVAYNQNARRFIERRIKQPLRELLDWLHHHCPWLFGAPYRLARQLNLALTRRTEH